MDRRGFLKGIIGSGVAVAAKKVVPQDGLVELKCKGCQGLLKAVGDFFECQYCGAKYALGGVVMQEEEGQELEKEVVFPNKGPWTMEDLHLMGETTCWYDGGHGPYWFATTASEAVVFDESTIYGFR